MRAKSKVGRTVRAWAEEGKRKDAGLILGAIAWLVVGVFTLADPTYRELGYGWLLMSALVFWLLWRKRYRPRPPD